jgi:hypothetical protein
MRVVSAMLAGLLSKRKKLTGVNAKRNWCNFLISTEEAMVIMIVLCPEAGERIVPTRPMYSNTSME